MMKTISLASFLAVACTATLGAQATETTTTTTTNIQMKGGKSVTLSGCVEAGPDGGYLLTHVADKVGVFGSYVLVTTNEYFAKHIGQRVRIEGKLADRSHGRVDVKSDTNINGVQSHVETDARTDPAAIRYLGPDHMKTIAISCP